ADVDEDLCGEVPVGFGHGQPRVVIGGTGFGGRGRAVGHGLEPGCGWELAEDGFVGGAAFRVEGDGFGDGGAGGVELVGGFERAGGLHPEGVCAAVPVEPGVVGGVEDARGVAGSGGRGFGDWQTVGEGEFGFVAGGAVHVGAA